MIAIDSTGYPCLAVIQHFEVPPEKHAQVYECGRKLLEAWLGGNVQTLYDAISVDNIVELGSPAMRQLAKNYGAAAREHKWGPYHNEH